MLFPKTCNGRDHSTRSRKYYIIYNIWFTFLSMYDITCKHLLVAANMILFLDYKEDTQPCISQCCCSESLTILTPHECCTSFSALAAHKKVHLSQFCCRGSPAGHPPTPQMHGMGTERWLALHGGRWGLTDPPLKLIVTTFVNQRHC